MKKRIISLVLCLAMILSVCPMVMAYSDENEVILYEVGNGEYSTVPKARNNISVIATKTDDENILFIEDNTYAVLNSVGTYQKSEKIDVNIENFNENEQIFQTYRISESLVEHMTSMSNEQKKLGNDEFSISVYAPSIIESSGALSRGLIDESTASYDYKGIPFQDYSVKYRNCATGPLLEQGSNTKNVAEEFTSFVIGAVGCIPKSVSIFGVALSALDLFEALEGPVTSGSQSDYLSINIVYDVTEKETNYYSGMWLHGQTTFMAYVDIYEMTQYYVSVGHSVFSTDEVGAVYRSENFLNPAKAVYDSGFQSNFDGQIYLSMLGYKKIYLTH